MLGHTGGHNETEKYCFKNNTTVVPGDTIKTQKVTLNYKFKTQCLLGHLNSVYRNTSTFNQRACHSISVNEIKKGI